MENLTGPTEQRRSLASSKPRAPPVEPRYAVAVTVVDWRGPVNVGSPDARVLMVKRGTEPARGKW